MKNKSIILSVAVLAVIICSLSAILFGCATPAMIASKSGTQLWGENCQRCHNTPSPTAFNDEHWEVVGMHMKVRANLTETEKDKIIEFLKSAN